MDYEHVQRIRAPHPETANARPATEQLPLSVRVARSEDPRAMREADIRPIIAGRVSHEYGPTALDPDRPRTRAAPPGRVRLSQPSLSIAVGAFVGTPVVFVAGTLDASTAPRLRRTLTEILLRQPPNLDLDLSRVVFIDAAGLGVLATAAKRCQLAGTHLRLIDASPPVRRVLQITRLGSSFDIVDSLNPGDHGAA
jgi:anti-sigma B factor antagonist